MVRAAQVMRFNRPGASSSRPVETRTGFRQVVERSAFDLRLEERRLESARSCSDRVARPFECVEVASYTTPTTENGK
jgi:hypothetical protein